MPLAIPYNGWKCLFFTTPCQVSFHHHLPPLFYLPPLSIPSGDHHPVFCLGSTFFPQSLHLFHPTPQPLSPLTAASLFSESMSLFLFCLLVYFVPQIPHVSEILWYLPLSDWLISFSIMSPGVFMLLQRVRFPFLWQSSIPLCRCTTTFLSTLYQWAPGLLPNLGYCE